jgi:hypothetical protein
MSYLIVCLGVSCFIAQICAKLKRPGRIEYRVVKP